MTIVEGWFKTDDLQACRKIREGVYGFVEFSQIDCKDKYISSYMIVDLAKYKTTDGEWNEDAISCVTAFYDSVQELYESYAEKDDCDQIIAECIFEASSQFGKDSMTMTENDAMQFLDNLIRGKIWFEWYFGVKEYTLGLEGDGYNDVLTKSTFAKSKEEALHQLAEECMREDDWGGYFFDLADADVDYFERKSNFYKVKLNGKSYGTVVLTEKVDPVM